jgi:REP element-mobilizing transposase RayT
MPRRLRIEYPGAIYHVMNRGNQRQNIFKDDKDRRRFLETLEESCAKTEWQIHAYCLMRNHFHLVIETPLPNLVAGMKWLLGVYTKRFNIRHKTCGHLFAGRYKALVVDGSGNGYLQTVCDYVHLNPLRAKLIAPGADLRAFTWSSYGEYLKPAAQRPVWLRVDRLLGEKGIRRDSQAGARQFALRMAWVRGRNNPLIIAICAAPGAWATRGSGRNCLLRHVASRGQITTVATGRRAASRKPSDWSPRAFGNWAGAKRS